MGDHRYLVHHVICHVRSSPKVFLVQGKRQEAMNEVKTVDSNSPTTRPLASSIFAPSVPQCLAEFGSNSTILGSLVVSIYILGYAAGPLAIAPLSGMCCYQRNNNVEVDRGYLLISITRALRTLTNVPRNQHRLYNFHSRMRSQYEPHHVDLFSLFRRRGRICRSHYRGWHGGRPLCAGGTWQSACFLDSRPDTRTCYWASCRLIPLGSQGLEMGVLAPCYCGMWLVWIFSLSSLFFAFQPCYQPGQRGKEKIPARANKEQSGSITASFLILLRETSSTAILRKKAKRARKTTGNPHFRSCLDGDQSTRQAFHKSIIRPIKLLVGSPIVASMSTFAAIIYGYLYLLFTSFTPVFEQSYGFSPDVVGLCYLGTGFGMIVSLFGFGVISDRMIKMKSIKNKGEMKPEYRLPPMILGGIFVPIGLLLYGWSAEKQVFWFVPILGTAFFGFGFMASFVRLVFLLCLYAESSPLYLLCDEIPMANLRSCFHCRCRYKLILWTFSPFMLPPLSLLPQCGAPLLEDCYPLQASRCTML
jgi:hypothetical protein